VVPTDVGAGQDRRRPLHVRGTDAHGGDVVLGGEPAAGLDKRVVELRPEQAVVDGLGDVTFAEAGDVEGHVTPVAGSRVAPGGRAGRDVVLSIID